MARLAERLGGRIELLLWTQRRYDLVGVVDLPCDQAFATLALEIGATGMARTESLRGFTADEFGTIVQQLDTGTTDGGLQRQPRQLSATSSRPERGRRRTEDHYDELLGT